MPMGQHASMKEKQLVELAEAKTMRESAAAAGIDLSVPLS